MGVLRLFLALCVLNLHCRFTDSYLLVHSFVPVCIFFIISGFYMSLVLDRKYRGDGGLRSFYVNRALRLYPIYWLIFVATLACNTTHLLPVGTFNHPSASSWQAVLTNLFLFPAALYRVVKPYAMQGDWIGITSGQMYTVGIEMLFYAVVPFLFKAKNPLLLMIAAAAAAIHFAPMMAGQPPSQALQYNWPLGVFIFFVMGRLSYSLYVRIESWKLAPVAALFFGAVILRWCYIYHWQLWDQWTYSRWTWGLYIVVMIGIPFIFAATKSSKIDFAVGELSYPLYACQFLVLTVVDTYVRDPSARPVYALIGSLCGAVVLTLTDRLVGALRRANANIRSNASRFGQGNTHHPSALPD